MDRRRQQRGELEVRRAASLDARDNVLHGYAAVFSTWSRDLGGFRERINPGAFRRSLDEDDGNLLALAGHDLNAVLGRTGANTLRLREDHRGLAFELELPDTSVGRDLRTLVSRGDVAGMSFGFRVRPGGEDWVWKDDVAERTLNDVELVEVSVTAAPAYTDTTVAKRHMLAHATRLAELSRFLELARLRG